MIGDKQKMDKNDFEPPGVFIKDVCTRILNQIFSDYHGYSVSQLRKIADDISYIPEFLGYETYLMLRPPETRRAEEIVNILLPFHIGMLLIDRVVDRNVTPSPELYLAVDLIHRCEKRLLAVIPNSSHSYMYNHYLKMLSLLQQASFERETLRENCSLSEYMRVIEKLSSPYTMCTVMPAMIAGVTNKNVLDILGNYARNLYVVFHILDDIRDLEEDKKAHRPNYVILSGSKKKAYEQCYSRLTNASDYIESVDIKNFHKKYMKWLTTFYWKVAIEEWR